MFVYVSISVSVSASVSVAVSVSVFVSVSASVAGHFAGAVIWHASALAIAPNHGHLEPVCQRCSGAFIDTDCICMYIYICIRMYCLYMYIHIGILYECMNINRFETNMSTIGLFYRIASHL